MHPAPDLRHAALRLEKGIVDRVGVGLQLAFVPFQKFRRARARSGGRVVVHDYRMMSVSDIRHCPSLVLVFSRIRAAEAIPIELFLRGGIQAASIL